MEPRKYNPTNDREKRMWGFMCRHQRFRYVDVMASAKVSRHHLDCFASKLRHLSLIKKVAREGADQFFTVMDDKAAAAFEARKKGKKEGVMWTAMRSLGAFTVPELMMVITSERHDILQPDLDKYCSILVRAEYLAYLTKAKRDGQPRRYKLINNSGPLAPILRTIQVVVDQNEDRLVWSAGSRI